MADARIMTVPQRQKGRERLGSFAARRESAFPEALRHSARVARLRRWMLWGAAGVVTLVAIGLFVGSLQLLPMDLSLARVALKGTRIVIETPKLVGYRKDGRPYEIRAKVGVQDLAKPDVFELDALEVRVENAQDNSIVLAAAKGVYSAKADHADMTGGVDIRDDKNFNMKLASAALDLKAGVMTSNEPVTLEFGDGEVKADSVEFAQKERRVTFAGGVHSVLYGEGGAPPRGLTAEPRTEP